MTAPTIESHHQAFSDGHVIRVVNYPSTRRAAPTRWSGEIARSSEAFAPVTMSDLETLFETGEWHKSKPGVLPVVYEGYRNSATVAAPICERPGLTAWLPLATYFLSTAVEHPEAFARAHGIYRVEEDLTGERIAMTWDETQAPVRAPCCRPAHGSARGIRHDPRQRRSPACGVRAEALMDAVTGQSAKAFAWLHESGYGRGPMHDRHWSRPVTRSCSATP